MRAEVLIAGLVALPLCLAGPSTCKCNGIINIKGQGECQTTYKGKQFCYVDQGNCKDQKKASSSGRYWSYEACKNYRAYGLECYGLKGDRCMFPFKWDGRTFNNCTTYKSENGAAWCATRVRGKDRDAVRGSLEDCSAPCDHGASPYEDCPRNPVIKGRSRDCCTPERPCRIGEGDCDSDDDCGYGLKCGDSNCAQFRPDNYAKADCCYNPKYSNQGKGNHSWSQMVSPPSLQLPAGTMAANTNMGKPSQLMTAATTVSVSQERLSALKRRAMEVSHHLCWNFFLNIHMQVISASVQLSVEQILEANVFSRSYFLECVTPTAPLRGQTMERHGAQPRSTIRDITSVARGTGATALPLAVALAMEEGGAPGNHGAAALPPVEEVRGVVQGAALVKAAQDRPWRLSGVTRRAAVIVVPGEHGAGARESVEGLAVRAGADRADRETVKGRRAAPARPRDAPARVAEAALG